MSYALVSRPVKVCVTCSRSVVTSSDAAKFICPRCRSHGRIIQRKQCAACSTRFEVAGTLDDRRRKACSKECRGYLISSALIERHKRRSA